MFNNDFVVAVKNDGDVLRERNNNVLIPFGSNYTILLKNLREECKAKVSISIDGEDVLNGRSIIVKPNDDVEFKRYINSSLEKGNRFKFIEASNDIRDNRDDNSMNGIIKVVYQFEKKYGLKDYIPCIKEDEQETPLWETTWSNDMLRSKDTMTFSNDTRDIKSREGVTTYGDIVEQKFSKGDIGRLEDEKNMIVLQLLGKNEEDEKISNTLTTESKIECMTCGRSVSSDFKYCPHCGTSLTVI